MNARSLLALIDDCGMLEIVNRSGRENGGWIQETILSALALQATAERNDGKTPLSSAVWDGICAREDLRGFAVPQDASDAIRLAEQMEAERTGLAAEVVRLREALRAVVCDFVPLDMVDTMKPNIRAQVQPIVDAELRLVSARAGK